MRFKPVSEFKAMQQLKTSGGDRSRFREWNEKLLNALAQVNPGYRKALNLGYRKALGTNLHGVSRAAGEIRNPIARPSWGPTFGQRRF